MEIPVTSKLRRICWVMDEACGRMQQVVGGRSAEPFILLGHNTLPPPGVVFGAAGVPTAPGWPPCKLSTNDRTGETFSGSSFCPDALGGGEGLPISWVCLISLSETSARAGAAC